MTIALSVWTPQQIAKLVLKGLDQFHQRQGGHPAAWRRPVCAVCHHAHQALTTPGRRVLWAPHAWSLVSPSPPLPLGAHLHGPVLSRRSDQVSGPRVSNVGIGPGPDLPSSTLCASHSPCTPEPWLMMLAQAPALMAPQSGGPPV